MEALTTKLADSKGRIMLGNKFANRPFIVKCCGPDGEITLTPAAVVPARELWLYENKKALGLVHEGLDEARAGRFSEEPPDLDADASLVDQLDD